MNLVRLAVLAGSILFGLRAGAAEPVSCGDLSSAASRDGGQASDLWVRNGGNVSVSLRWIDSQGHEVTYASIAPHSLHRQPSFDGHTWLLRSAAGGCVCALRLAGRTRWTHEGDRCEHSAIGPYEPTSKYQQENVEGWRVLVSSQFANAPVRRKLALSALQVDLASIRRRLPRPANALLRKTKVWLELTDPLFPDGAVYHPYAEFLSSAGMNPDKLRSVQFTARSLEERPRQPAMVLHEFAHAFHDQALGYGDPTILTAYFRACSDPRLLIVERDAGHPERHYGLKNQTEFFAEFTEAYFWENDYPPKRRDDLVKLDPSIAEVIALSWKKRRLATPGFGGARQVCPAKQ